MSKMHFDVVIGNPPYQEEAIGEQKTFYPPIYDKFLDAAYGIADKVMMIHPARFLFKAGKTPAAWNRKMLADEHLKVLYYEADSRKVFSGVDIKGGVVVTYRDAKKKLGPIGVFTAYEELNSMLQKVVSKNADFKPFSSIIYGRNIFRFTDNMHEEFPEAKSKLSAGHAYDLSANIFDRLPEVFHEEQPKDGHAYIQILGRQNGQRVYKYIRCNFVRDTKNLDKWKVFVPKASGSGALGEALSTPLIGTPFVGSTETFISIGALECKEEAEAILAYIKTRFARAMLGILKSTQDNTREKWIYVPMQDFTGNSDIDWKQSIGDIDRQLYKKYALTEKEIAFLETKIKEMF